MQVFHFACRWVPFTAPFDARMERHTAYPQLALPVLRHLSYGFVFIACRLQARINRDMQKPEYVTARHRCDKRFLWVNAGCIGPRCGHNAGRRRSWHNHATVKVDRLLTLVAALEEIGACVLPADSGGVDARACKNHGCKLRM